jgi:hypothetical protein
VAGELARFVRVFDGGVYLFVGGGLPRAGGVRPFSLVKVLSITVAGENNYKTHRKSSYKVSMKY